MGCSADAAMYADPKHCCGYVTELPKLCTMKLRVLGNRDPLVSLTIKQIDKA